MMRFTLIVLIALCFSCSNDTLNPSDITLSTQQAVDDFKYTIVNGNLTIQGREINNLNGLSCLKHVKGHLYIRNTYQLADLSGLDNIVEIDSSLHIDRNYALNSIASFNNLQGIGTSIYISQNQRLETVDFSNPDFVFQGTIQLQDLDVLRNASFAGKLDSSIVSLSSLSKLRSLRNLCDASHLNSLVISNLSAIKYIDIAPSINSIEYLNISRIPSIINLNGLANIVNIERLGINHNPMLKSLDGLANLSSIKELLVIQGNPLLTDYCELATVVSSMNESRVIIKGNAYDPSVNNFISGECRTE